ncbi:helix-turn-helix domain-containing protein [Sphingomonas sp. BK069]|uniref:helix-turn-helix domain-containing protein n=1 Tax=Sphingomonas sp. BK069 TaxID=2586979 RepID=UPI001619FB47|nr:helix-turn-helix domain-containing protein [Sphingomonas sp. BK069]MBB3345972.1 hypothetical protein [Sphingomonas sp. BK069]
MTFTLAEAAACAAGKFADIVHADKNCSSSRRKPAAAARRGSLEEGSFEETFFRAPSPGEVYSLSRLARSLCDQGRVLTREARSLKRKLSVRERSVAKMTALMLRVYDEFLKLARTCNGRIFPSYEWLAKAAAVSISTVAEAIKVFVEVGLLDRQRRFRMVAVEGGGTRYAQTSNAYRVCVPQRVLSLLPRAFRPAPAPHGTVSSQHEQPADEDAYGDAPRPQSAPGQLNKSPLLRALADLRDAIERRASDSEFRTQS